MPDPSPSASSPPLSSPPPHAGWSRRDVLRVGTVGVAACALTAGTGCSLFVHTEKPSAIVTPLAGRVSLPAELSARLLREGGNAWLEVKGRPDKLLVFGPAGGPLRALSAECTHRGCDVAFQPDLGRIVCPCHGSEFAPDGSNLQGPADEPLPRFEVREERGRVVITL